MELSKVSFPHNLLHYVHNTDEIMIVSLEEDPNKHHRLRPPPLLSLKVLIFNFFLRRT